MAGETTMNTYGTGSNSTIGSQIRTDYFYKKALVEAAKEAYFGQLADVRSMPKNFGKTIKQYHYLPILDDRNLNDQGINALGLDYDGPTTSPDVVGNPATFTYKLVEPAFISKYTNLYDENKWDSVAKYFSATVDVDATYTTYEAALAAAVAKAKASVVAYIISETSLAFDTSEDNTFDNFFTIGAAENDVSSAGTAHALDYRLVVVEPGGSTTANSGLEGNLYGSSKDVGTITSKLPSLSETGGRVNRVGHKRIEIEGSIEKFGFFDEYTQESMDFDSDAELEMHLTQEMVKAANEITEDQIQIDLLNGAGVIRYTGAATSAATLQGNDASDPIGTNDVVTYDDLVKLAIELRQNRTPKNTKLIAGSRMIDTKVINGAYYAYVGSELLPTLMRMTDYHGNKAWIPVAQYADAGNVARGEIGAIDNFRFIEVPEMMHWAAAGADVTDGVDTLYQNSSNDAGALKYDVFPILVVGDGSFATIGFQTDGKTVKFKIVHKKPGKDLARPEDPYGETGFMSIKWYYGSMILRPERLAVIKTIAEWG